MASTAESIPKLVSDMTPDERLASLRAWAEEQKYITPGEGGTLAVNGLYNQQTVYSGPVKFVQHYAAPLAPPSYETVIAETAKKDKKAGLIKKWLGKKKHKADGDEVLS